GPLVLAAAVGWEAARARDGRGRKVLPMALAAIPALAILACLLLTKSRSAYLGLAVGLGVLAWQARRSAPVRRPTVPPGALRGRAGGRGRPGSRGAVHAPAGPRGADRGRQVAPLSAGILGRSLAGHQRLDPGLLVGLRPGELRCGVPEAQASRVERGDQRPPQP